MNKAISEPTIKIRKPNIGIIGLGYVGLPLAIEFSKKYEVIGFDKNKKRVENLLKGYDQTNEVSSNELKKAKLIFTSNKKIISNCNVFIVTVPTPVDKAKRPDLGPLKSASTLIGHFLKKGDLVIYESTVYPGATNEQCVPILEEVSGLEYKIDFHCGYSPERINPGDKNHKLKNIIKITSASSDSALDCVDKLYSSIIPAGTHRAPSIKVAEAAKVIENIQRDVNIALINEFSKIFKKLEVNTEDVLSAANTKWNFLSFKPGLVGGHCIGVDPYYLTHKAQELEYHPEIILAGRKINDSMGEYIAENLVRELTMIGTNPKGATVSIFGLTFKENCPDTRNTKVVDIINNLKAYGCSIKVVDPFVDKKEVNNNFGINIKKIEDIKKIDAAIVAVAHDNFKNINKEKWLNFYNKKGIFMDVKSIYNNKIFENTNIKYWSL